MITACFNSKTPDMVKRNISTETKLDFRNSQNLDSVSFGSYQSCLNNIAKHCSYCGEEVLTQAEGNELIRQMLILKNKELQKVLEITTHKLSKLKNYYPNYLLCSDLLDLSKKFPHKIGEELIDFYKAHQLERRIKTLQQYKNQKRQTILPQLIKLMPALPENVRGLVQIAINRSPSLKWLMSDIVGIINKSEKNGIVLPDEFKAIYNDYKKDKKARLNTKKYTAMLDNTANRILEQMITPLRVTMEHLKPNSIEKQKIFYNYLPVCECCNGERKNIKFNTWLETHPTVKFFIIHSLKELKTTIAKMSAPTEGLRNYIANICANINKEAEGLLYVKAETL